MKWLAGNETYAVPLSIFFPIWVFIHSHSKHLADTDKFDFAAPKVSSYPLTGLAGQISAGFSVPLLYMWHWKEK